MKECAGGKNRVKSFEKLKWRCLFLEGYCPDGYTEYVCFCSNRQARDQYNKYYKEKYGEEKFYTDLYKLSEFIVGVDKKCPYYKDWFIYDKERKEKEKLKQKNKNEKIKNKKWYEID